MESKKAEGQIFNVGNDREISIKELAKLIIEMTGSSSKLEFIPYNVAYEEGFEDMQRRVPDTTKLTEYIEFSPKVPLEELLQKVIDWQEKERE